MESLARATRVATLDEVHVRELLAAHTSYYTRAAIDPARIPLGADDPRLLWCALDDAAAIHGATKTRILTRIILPLSLPGLIVGFLTIFNLSMGAFTSAALLGGGRIITLPVLIQRTMLIDVKYGMAGALAAMLLLFVIVLNLVSVIILKRFRATRGITV